MATVDPLQTLQAALAQPQNSVEQAEQLAVLREALEARPQPLPILCATLLGTIAAGVEDSLLKRFVLDLIHFGIARANLSPEQRTQRMWFNIICLNIQLTRAQWRRRALIRSQDCWWTPARG